MSVDLRAELRKAEQAEIAAIRRAAIEQKKLAAKVSAKLQRGSS